MIPYKHTRSVVAAFTFFALSHVPLGLAQANPDAQLSQLHTLYAQCVDKNGKENPGKLKAMVGLMKDILKANPNDSLVKENVLALYKSAYDNFPSHALPSDWQLPPSLSYMRIAARRNVTQGETNYSLVIKGVESEADAIKQFQVIHYPDQVVFDKLAGQGRWEEEGDPNLERHPVPPNLQLETQKMNHPYDTGLYLLKMELKNGSKVEGWFLMDDEMVATTAPEVVSPSVGETLGSGNPTVKWLNYQSAQYKPYEKRILWVGVDKVGKPSYEWDEKWNMYKESPSVQQATIGTDGSFNKTDQQQLENGDYVLQVNYREMRPFGDIEIGRYSTVVRPFKIQH